MATHSSILAWKSHGLGAWQSTVHGVAESDVTEGLRTMTNDTIPVLGDEMLGDVETRRVRSYIFCFSSSAEGAGFPSYSHVGGSWLLRIC